MGHFLVCKSVGQVKQPLCGGFVGCVKRSCQRRQAALHPARGNRVASRLNAQALDSAFCIDGSVQTGHMHGAVEVMGHVFFAAPEQLHGARGGCHGNTYRLRDGVHLQAPAKSTPQQGDVQGDFVDVYARHLGRNFPGHFWHLGGGPNFYFAVFDLGRAVHGLHGGVGQVGRVVNGFNHLFGRRFGFGCIALGVKSRALVGLDMG